MDKEFLMDFLNNQHLKHTYEYTDISRILESYCLEHGKKSEDIAKFIEALLNQPGQYHLRICLAQVLEYYIRKYTIHEVRKPCNGGYQVLLYFN